jgi:hypothetical protein
VTTLRTPPTSGERESSGLLRVTLLAALFACALGAAGGFALPRHVSVEHREPCVPPRAGQVCVSVTHYHHGRHLGFVLGLLGFAIAFSVGAERLHRRKQREKDPALPAAWTV